MPEILVEIDQEWRGVARFSRVERATGMEPEVSMDGAVLHIGDDSVDRNDLTLCPRCGKVKFRYGVQAKDGRVCSRGCVKEKVEPVIEALPSGSLGLTLGLAAKARGLTTHCLYQAIRRGRLHGKRDGRVWLVTMEEIDWAIAEGRIKNRRNRRV